MPNGFILKNLLLFIAILEVNGTLYAQENNNDTLKYEVTQIDKEEENIQRLFIVIDSADVHNAVLIQKIVIEVCANYTLNNNSHLSFFCGEKYADYKDNLFFGDRSEYNMKDYYKWRNNYYLAEFDFTTKVYTSYPANNEKKLKSKKITILQGC